MNVEKQYYEKKIFGDSFKFIRFANDFGTNDGNETGKRGGCRFDGCNYESRL